LDDGGGPCLPLKAETKAGHVATETRLNRQNSLRLFPEFQACGTSTTKVTPHSRLNDAGVLVLNGANMSNTCTNGFIYKVLGCFVCKAQDSPNPCCSFSAKVTAVNPLQMGYKSHPFDQATCE
jgi:hypothetical protein